MLTSDLLRGAVVAGIAALTASDGLHIWSLVVLSAVFGVGDAFFMPAFTAVVSVLVADDLLIQANALTGTSQLLAQSLIGPALGGILVAAAGTAWAFAFDAFTFAVSGLCLLLLRTPAGSAGPVSLGPRRRAGRPPLHPIPALAVVDDRGCGGGQLCHLRPDGGAPSSARAPFPGCGWLCPRRGDGRRGPRWRDRRRRPAVPLRRSSPTGDHHLVRLGAGCPVSSPLWALSRICGRSPSSTDWPGSVSPWAALSGRRSSSGWCRATCWAGSRRWIGWSRSVSAPSVIWPPVSWPVSPALEPPSSSVASSLPAPAPCCSSRVSGRPILRRARRRVAPAPPGHGDCEANRRDRVRWAAPRLRSTSNSSVLMLSRSRTFEGLGDKGDSVRGCRRGRWR